MESEKKKSIQKQEKQKLNQHRRTRRGNVCPFSSIQRIKVVLFLLLQMVLLSIAVTKLTIDQPSPISLRSADSPSFIFGHRRTAGVWMTKDKSRILQSKLSAGLFGLFLGRHSKSQCNICRLQTTTYPFFLNFSTRQGMPHQTTTLKNRRQPCRAQNQRLQPSFLPKQTFHWMTNHKRSSYPYGCRLLIRLSISPNASSKTSSNTISTISTISNGSNSGVIGRLGRFASTVIASFTISILRSMQKISTSVINSFSIFASGQWIRQLMKCILIPIPPSIRYFLQPLLIIYYVPLIIIRRAVIAISTSSTLPDSSTVNDFEISGKNQQRKHDAFIQYWKHAVDVADRSTSYWPIHLDGKTNQLYQDMNELDFTDAVVESVQIARSIEDNEC